MTLPNRELHPWLRYALKLALRFATTRLGGWIFTTITPPLDRFLLRVSRGQYSIAGIVAPTLLLTTTGRRSGVLRTTPLLYLRENQHIILVGSRGGREKPAFWYLNLLAEAHCSILADGISQTYLAQEAQGEERARLWQRFVEFNPGFNRYQERITRRIPVMVLSPTPKPGP